MTRRALVTGAAGFVGKVLVAHLRDAGWDVTGCDVAASSGVGECLPCDLSDREQVESVLAQTAPLACVFHLAAVTFVPDADRDPAKAFDINVLGTVYLATAMRRHCPKARLVYVGSSEVYGPPQSLPVDETHPLNPSNPYAISKAASDQYCGYLHHAGALDTVRMRPFNHSGPGQSDAFVLSSFARQVARIEVGRAEAVLRVGDLSTSRDFSHVRDVVRAYELAAEKGMPGEAYNICSGKPVVVRDALDWLLQRARVAIRVEPDPARMRPVDIPCSYGSHEKLAAHTGWQPELGFEDVLQSLLDYWRTVESNQSR